MITRIKSRSVAAHTLSIGQTYLEGIGKSVPPAGDAERGRRGITGREVDKFWRVPVLLRELGIGLQPPEPTDFLAKIAARAELSYRVERLTNLLELSYHSIFFQSEHRHPQNYVEEQ